MNTAEIKASNHHGASSVGPTKLSTAFTMPTKNTNVTIIAPPTAIRNPRATTERRPEASVSAMNAVTGVETPNDPTVAATVTVARIAKYRPRSDGSKSLESSTEPRRPNAIEAIVDKRDHSPPVIIDA